MEAEEPRWFGHILDKSFKHLRVIVISDPHYGNPLFSEKHFTRTLEFVKNNPDVYCILNGDLCESSLRTSKGDIYKQVGTPQDQRDWIIEKLTPLRDRILGMTSGNHEMRIYNEAGMDISKDIAAAFHVPYRQEGIFLKIMFGDGNDSVDGRPYVFWAYCTHGYGGARTKSAKAVKVERLGTWAHADFYCLHPYTKVLRGDLTWDELGNINIGDELIGVSEYPEFNQTRQVIHTTVTEKRYRKSPVLKITLEDDITLVTTSEHLWLIKRRHDGNKLGGRYNWYRTDQLSIGDEMLQVFSKWNTPDDWISGYISGLLDGEGYISVGNRRERMMGFAQNEGVVLSFFEEYLHQHNISYRKYQQEGGCYQLIIRLDAARLIGMVQPKRLALKARNLVEKRLHKPHTVRIVAIESAGESNVVTIETDKRTFLAEGFATHNCMSHDHVVNVSPDVYLIPDNRGTIDTKTGFLTGKLTAHRKMLIKTNAYLKWGGYSERGGFPPVDLATPVIFLLTPESDYWKLLPERPQKTVKVIV